jgi:hypothetical protein
MRKTDAIYLWLLVTLISLGVIAWMVESEPTQASPGPKTESVVISESEIGLSEAGLLDGLNALVKSEGKLPEVFFGSFEYITVIKGSTAGYGEEYIVAFSDEKPIVRRQTYVDSPSQVDFIWPDAQQRPNTNFHLLRLKNQPTWFTNHTSSGALGVGNLTLFRTIEMKTVKPILFASAF